MDRKAACIAQASICREMAQTEPERQEYWIDESIRWLERAIERSDDGTVSYEVIDGRLVVMDEQRREDARLSNGRPHEASTAPTTR
jgi:hypothetical protein